SSVTRVFIVQKIRSIAVLKCVGARSVQIIAVYVLQVLTLGLAGSVLGVIIARVAVGAIPLALASSAPSLLTDVHYGVKATAAARAGGGARCASRAGARRGRCPGARPRAPLGARGPGAPVPPPGRRLGPVFALGLRPGRRGAGGEASGRVGRGRRTGNSRRALS